MSEVERLRLISAQYDNLQGKPIKNARLGAVTPNRASKGAMNPIRQTINELKRTIHLIKQGGAPNGNKVIAGCRHNIKWLRQLEKAESE